MHTTSIAMWRAIWWTFDIQIVIPLHKQISHLQLYFTDFVKIFIYFQKMDAIAPIWIFQDFDSWV